MSVEVVNEQNVSEMRLKLSFTRSVVLEASGGDAIVLMVQVTNHS
jgi:hypothetical protein